MDRQTSTHFDRQIGRQADRWTGRKVDWQTGQVDKQTCRQVDRQTGPSSKDANHDVGSKKAQALSGRRNGSGWVAM